MTNRYKLVHLFGPMNDCWELFDRQTDPKELSSVFGSAEYTAIQREREAEVARSRAVTGPDPETKLLPPKKK